MNAVPVVWDGADPSEFWGWTVCEIDELWWGFAVLVQVYVVMDRAFAV